MIKEKDVTPERRVKARLLLDKRVMHHFDKAVEKAVVQSELPLCCNNSPYASPSNSYYVDIPYDKYPIWILKAEEYRNKDRLGVLGLALTDELISPISGIFFRRFNKDSQLYFHKINFPHPEFVIPYIHEALGNAPNFWIPVHDHYLRLVDATKVLRVQQLIGSQV